MFPLRLKDPVEVTGAICDEVREISLQEDINGETLSWLPDKWYAQCTYDLATGTVGTKEIPGLYFVGVIGYRVVDGGEDGCWRCSREGYE